MLVPRPEPRLLGFNGSGVKSITEFEAAHNYVHDEQGNGIWCDVGCKDDRPGGTTASGSTTTSPWTMAARGSVTSTARKVLQQASMLRAKTRSSRRTRYTATPTVPTGGISVLDGQNALIRANVFGAATIAGVAYRANVAKPGAVKASESGGATGPTLGTWTRGQRPEWRGTQELRVARRGRLLRQQRLGSGGISVGAANNSPEFDFLE